MLTYPEAMSFAEALIRAIEPHCMQRQTGAGRAFVEIAGSLRRRKPVVKDIEIVAITRREERTKKGLLFDEPYEADVLFTDWAEQGAIYYHPCGIAAGIQWIKTGTKNGEQLQPRPVEPFGFYWRGILWLEQQYAQDEIDWSVREDLLPPHVKLDLFLTTPEKWGVIFLLRTGSSDFNLALIDHINTNTLLRIREGRIMDQGRALETPEERDVFDVLGLEWVEPEERKDGKAIRRKVKPAPVQRAAQS